MSTTMEEEDENNGYVVLKWNILGSAVNYRVVVSGMRTPQHFIQGLLEIFKDDVNDFSST